MGTAVSVGVGVKVGGTAVLVGNGSGVLVGDGVIAGRVGAGVGGSVWGSGVQVGGTLPLFVLASSGRAATGISVGKATT